MTRQKLEQDQWGRNEIYLAEYKNVSYGGHFIFASLDAAIFYVISGLGNSVDCSKFPDPIKNYPDEDRNGTNKDRTPRFIVKQFNSRGVAEVSGSVTKTAVMGAWIVGNGIAEASKKYFEQATGRDVVELSGIGDKLQGKVGK